MQRHGGDVHITISLIQCKGAIAVLSVNNGFNHILPGIPSILWHLHAAGIQSDQRPNPAIEAL